MGRRGGARGALAAAAALAALAGLGAGGLPGARAQEPLDEAACQERLGGLLTLVGNLLTDPAVITCANGASERCCEGLGEYIGKTSKYWGCSCYQDIMDSVLIAVPSFARPLVETRMVDCGIPVPMVGCPIGADGEMAALEPSNSTEPDFGQSEAQEQYTGAYSFINKGYESYGEWDSCTTLEDSRYCMLTVQTPGRFAPTKWGVCVPSEMGESDLESAVSATDIDHYERKPPSANCGILRGAPIWDRGSIACGVFLLVVAALFVLSTARAWAQRRLGWRRGSSWFSQVLQCWDGGRNWEVLMRCPGLTGELDFRAMNGFRVLSLWWVIMGHTGSGLFFNYTITNYSFWGFNSHNYAFMQRWFFCLYAGLFAVDTFLFIGAVLVAFKASQEMERRRKSQTLTFVGELQFWTLYVVNRWLRILPVLAVVLFLGWKFVGNMVDSPFWTFFYKWVYDERCKDYWWATLLFVQNFYPGGASFGADPKFCVGVSWYLAVDMQLYMFVAPVVLIAWHYGFYSKVVFRFRKVIGGVLLGLLLVGSLAWTTHIVVTKKVAWQFMGIGDYDSYYIMPWVRAPPYLCGLGLGLLLHHLTTKEGSAALKRLKGARWWTFTPVVAGALVLMSLVIAAPGVYFADATTEMMPVTTATGAGLTEQEIEAYMSTRHTAWGIVMFILGGVCFIGRGWILSGMLKGWFWAPLAKLTYGAYLLSNLIQDVAAQTAFSNPIYYTTYFYLSWWVAFVCGSYFASFVMFMLIEAPCGNLQKLLLSCCMPRRRSESGSQAGESHAQKIHPEGVGLSNQATFNQTALETSDSAGQEAGR